MGHFICPIFSSRVIRQERFDLRVKDESGFGEEVVEGHRRRP